jgi:hypothetical protein
MLNEHLHYEIVDSRARPARIAVLIDANDTEWHHTTTRIVELLSAIWGGKQGIIVPTNGPTVDSVFWALLEMFSPDYIFQYLKTGRDLSLSQPEKFNAIVEREISHYAGTSGEDVEKEREQEIRKALSQAWVDRFGLDNNLRRELANRLVPFHFDMHFDSMVSGQVPHKLTEISNVLSETARPSAFLSFQVDVSLERIWWVAHLGVYADEASAQLQQLGINERRIEIPEGELFSFVKWAVRGEPDSADRIFRQFENAAPRFAPPDESERTPFDISMSGVAFYGSPLTFDLAAQRFGIVIGNSLQDFCLAYCLRRVGYPAVWLPEKWTNEFTNEDRTPLRSCVRSAIWAAGYDLLHRSGVKACSVSLDQTAVRDVLENLKRYAGLGLNGEVVEYVDAVALINSITPSPIAYCIDSPNNSEIYPFLGSRTAGPTRTPTPQGFRKLSALKHHWVVDVNAGAHPVPAIPHLAEYLLDFGNSGGTLDKRVSNQGLAYACPPPGLIIGDDIRSNLQRPYVRLFNTYDAINKMAVASGFRCQLSDKGIYQRDALQRFGSLARAAELFSESTSRTLFSKFLDHSRAKGIYDEGCVLHADKRTYVNLEAAQKAMGGDQIAAVALLDRLVAAKILYRGFVLGCGICKHTEWYSFGAFRDEFRCSRCGREQSIEHKNWRHPAAPQVFYKLDEVVYQFLRNDGDIVTLALNYMARTSTKPFDYTPELRVEALDGSWASEIDLCAAWDGTITIGEVKKQGQLGCSEVDARKIVAKYVRLSEAFHARRVVFATMSPCWKSASLRAICQAFEGHLATTILLTSVDLLGQSNQV